MFLLRENCKVIRESKKEKEKEKKIRIVVMIASGVKEFNQGKKM